MMLWKRRTIPLYLVLFALLLCLVPLRSADTLPSQLSDDEFWNLINRISEPDGSFFSDNYVSNERSYQDVFEDLVKTHQPSSAYIGVGPEQNFTYILALKPRIAFIVDIRRQNLIEHLMYKALFELSSDRAEFLSRLFSRQVPQDLDRSSSIGYLLDDLASQPPSLEIYQNNLDAIESQLIRKHGFSLSAADEMSLEKVYLAFRAAGPSLTYNGPTTPAGVMPGFGEIVRQTARDGINRGFLASEENYRAIRELERKNLLIPVVGDFAGPRALKSVGQYLNDHNATVSAFYTSNVEQYLFGNNVWKDFYKNVATLPVNSNSIFVRGIIVTPTGEYSPSPLLPLTSHYETGLFSIPELVEAFRKGSILTYTDIVSHRL